MSEEIRFHIDMEAARLEKSGLPHAEARRRAIIAFGGVEGVKEEMRARRSVPIIEAAARDVRYALRALWSDRTFTLVSALTLAIGIGASTATFSVLRGVLWRELPVRDAKHVAVIWTSAPAGSAEHLPVSWAELQSYQRTTRAFTDVAGVNFQGAVDVVMRDGTLHLPISASWVTGGFFHLLGTSPALGRALEPADDAPGAAPVLVIGYALWQQQFGGAATALDRTLTLNGVAYRVVGVMPRGFDYPRHTQAWLPVLRSFPATLNANAPPDSSMVFDVVGRVVQGQDMATARDDFSAFLRETDSERPLANRERRAVLTTFPDTVHGEVRGTLLTVLASVGLLLCIACLNVANLLLIRGAVRTQELAIRAALGAGRARLVRQLLTETFVLVSLGGVLGTALAAVLVPVLVRLAPPQLPQRDMIGFDIPVLLAAAALTAAAALLAGLIPALLSVRADLGIWLRGGRHTAAGMRPASVLRSALVAGQVALAVLVVVFSGLFVRSLRSMQQIELGFAANELTIVETILSSDLPPDRDRTLAVQESMRERVAALPGVRAVTTAPKPPFSAMGGWLAPFHGEQQSDAESSANPVASLEVVGPDFFVTLGLRVLSGRGFDSRDRKDGAPVAVISRLIAERVGMGQNAVGKRIKLGPPGNPGAWRTVVGVVDDTRYRDLTATLPTLYLPASQFGGPVPMTLIVRSDELAPNLMPQIRAALREVHPDLAIASGGSMSSLLDTPMARPRFSAFLFGILALATLFLAAVGIYGSLAATVRERRRELGIRLALGATARDLTTLVLRRGMRLAIIGCVVGFAAAFASTRLVEAMLFEVAPMDLTTYGTVLVVVLATAAIACWIPARRAGRVDPMRVLHEE
jgi:predicted permease